MAASKEDYDQNHSTAEPHYQTNPIPSNLSHDAEMGSPPKSVEETENEKATAAAMDFPEGGARGWATAAGTAGVMFCTFGYINTFG